MSVIYLLFYGYIMVVYVTRVTAIIVPHRKLSHRVCRQSEENAVVVTGLFLRSNSLCVQYIAFVSILRNIRLDDTRILTSLVTSGPHHLFPGDLPRAAPSRYKMRAHKSQPYKLLTGSSYYTGRLYIRK